MQLHRLRLAAIGPFAQPVEIDLDRLSASGIFLLEGPTGAGKSTLIDAIVFALYGEVAGQASSNERIASAVASDDVAPSVELDFSTSHGMFRVRRSPKHARRKRRGSGTTIENASGALWRLVSTDAEAVGEPIATRLDEVGAEILDIVGLSREQFVQTVVLPQGEFATFLRAGAEQRRSLLEKLFGTEVYVRTVDRLVELRREANRQRSAAATTVGGSVSAYCGAAGLSREDEQALAERVELDPDDAVTAIQHQLDSFASAATTSEAAVTAATERTEQARARHSELTRREAARAKVLALREQLVALDAGEAALEGDVRRHSAAVEAARLMPMVKGLAESQARVTSAATALAAVADEQPVSDTPAAQWGDRERECREQAAAMGPLVEVEMGLAQARHDLGVRRAERDVLSDRCEELAMVLAEAPESIAALRSRLDEARAGAATLADVRSQEAAAKVLVRASRDLVEVAAEVDGAKRELTKRARRARTLIAREATLRARFIDGMAGHLAAALEPDQPCPVCGSPEHPDPAHEAEPVDRADLDAAVEQVADATRLVEASRDQLTALESAAAELRGVVGARSVDESLAELATVEQRLATAEAAEVAVVQLANELQTAEQRQVEQRALLQDAEKTRSSMDASIASHDAAVRKDEQSVLAALDGHESVAARARALTEQGQQWQSALEALARVAAAEGDVGVRQIEVDKALSGSPFDTVEAVRAAFVDADELQRLQSSIESRRQVRAHCEAELASPELASVDVAEIIDLEAARSALDAAETALAEAQAEHAQRSQRLTDSRTRAGEIQNSLSAQRAVADSTAATIRMADLASAGSPDNAKSMSLPTFVLRERFADVVSSANERLTTMSDGRYRLEHVEDRRGNRRSGLDLLVRDAHSERPRDPATLSGGESFYCSLALALGLADVVTAEAGGVDLGTLFVDEGFGSLDADTLEQVLEVLQGLASSGRVVGIVSHVPELKDQIAERISVIPNRDGSSRLVVAA